ncbi:MAG TPA: DUF4013 domain-containing protein [Candidatus Gordonibacter avicola]|nr:DUF4013 domain-containing protein [Candidatus Gordonibacter avicola]
MRAVTFAYSEILGLSYAVARIFAVALKGETVPMGYFNAAWQDIKNSPGWFGKLVVLGLVSLIPIFGWIVVYGYLYGWGRDIAWGVHAPLPAHVFGNEDGRLYSRGFFVMVIGLVCSLAPWLVDVVAMMLTGSSAWGWHYGGHFSFPFGMASGVVGLVLFALSLAAMLFAVLFFWAGSMRMSIYGRLSAGFQLGRLWSMLRRDFNGMLRILGMAVLLMFFLSVAVTIFIIVVVVVGMLVGFIATGGNLNINANHPGAAIMGMIFTIGGVAVILALLAGFASSVMTVFITAMITRALGYWTRQFDVPAWRGQDDPMPFELAGAVGSFGGPGQQPPYGQPPLR